MFNWIGGNIFDGIMKKLEGSGPALAQAFGKAVTGFCNTPGVNIPTVLWNILKEAPKYWDNLPEEQKQALFAALVAAGTKALQSYAKKPA